MMVRKHYSKVGRRAGALMKLNRPDCQTTNEMTSIGTQPITGEKFSSFAPPPKKKIEKVDFVPNEKHEIRWLRAYNYYECC